LYGTFAGTALTAVETNPIVAASQLGALGMSMTKMKRARGEERDPD